MTHANTEQLFSSKCLRACWLQQEPEPFELFAGFACPEGTWAAITLLILSTIFITLVCCASLLISYLGSCIEASGRAHPHV